jgi:anaerobic ribonucleoside-triphosphate reductase activating protein
VNVCPPTPSCSPQRLRLHALQPSSRANGPGLRCTIWLQGCTLGCPGCFNPETHTADGGEWVEVETLARRILALAEPAAGSETAHRIEGLTISGGEPLQQLPALLHLLQAVRLNSRLGILLFSGYTWDEIQRMPAAGQLLGLLDVLIAGRYQANRRLGQGLLGSTNQSIHLLTGRHTLAELQSVPEAEIFITPDGQVIFSGIGCAA